MKNELARQIWAGRFAAGRLPSLRRLADMFDVSLLTAQRAVKALAQDGLVTCRGTTRAAVMAPMHDNYPSAWDGAHRQGRHRPAGSRKAYLRLWTPAYSLGHREAWRRVIDEFHETYPWVAVQWDFHRPAPESAENLGGYDVLYLYAHDLPDHRRRGIIQSLAPFMARDDVFDPTAFTPMARRAAILDGEWFSIPHYINIPMLFHHPLILERAGWKPAHGELCVPRSWTAFMALAESLFRAGKGGVNSQSPVVLWNYLNRDFLRAVVRRGNRKLFETLAKALRLTYWPNAAGFPARPGHWVPAWKHFRRSAAGFSMDYSYRLLELSQQDVAGIQLAGMPLAREGVPVYFEAMHAMGACADHREEAWLLLRHLASPQVCEQVCAPIGRVPVHRVHHQSPRFLWSAPDQRRLVAAIEAGAELLPTSSRLNRALEAIICPRLQAWFEGKADLAAIWTDVRERLAEVLNVYQGAHGAKLIQRTIKRFPRATYS